MLCEQAKIDEDGVLAEYLQIFSTICSKFNKNIAQYIDILSLKGIKSTDSYIVDIYHNMLLNIDKKPSHIT